MAELNGQSLSKQSSMIQIVKILRGHVLMMPRNDSFQIFICLGRNPSVISLQFQFAAARACASRSSTSGSIAGGIGIVAFTGPIG